MPIRFACIGCGKSIKVGDELAGRRVKCNGCGGVQVVPEAAAVLETVPAETSDPFATRGTARRPSAPPPPPRPTAKARVPVGVCPDCHNPVDPGAPLCRQCGWVNPALGMARRPLAADAISGPQRGFMHDVIKSFTFHFKGNGPWTFGFTVILLTVAPFIGQLGFGGFLGWLVIEGLYCALLLSVILDTCAGEDELPALEIGDGMWESVFKPMFLFLGGTLVAAWPMIGWLAYMGLNPDAPLSSPLVGLAMIVLSVLLWPMTMLTIAINGWSLDHLRHDKQIITIARAIGPYLLICTALGAVVGMWIGLDILSERMMASDSRDWGELIKRYAAMLFIGALCQTYFSFAAMRIIGLFYRHYKSRFAWQAE